VIPLDHPIKNYITDTDLTGLFDIKTGTLSKFNTFCDRLETVALDKYPADLDSRNGFKGRVFELFVEFLIKRCGQGDNRIAIKDYMVIDATDKQDYGVDGSGRSTINNGPVTVQVKYRQEICILTHNEGRLSNFYQQSREDFFDQEIPPFIPLAGRNANMVVITSAGSIHHSVRDIWKGKIRSITRQGLRELTDNVSDFWESFIESIKESRTKLFTAPRIVLRNHQNEIVEAIIESIEVGDKKGQIIAPTGPAQFLSQAL
jgi:predicted helicase